MKQRATIAWVIMVSMLVAGALVTQTATASPRFNSASSHTITKGTTGPVVIEFGSGNRFECSTNHFEITTSSTSQGEMTASSEVFTSCLAFGFAGTDVFPNGCDYLYTSTMGEPIHLNCPTGKAIEVTPTIFGFSVCTVRLLPGTYKSVAYDNIANGDIEITKNLSGMIYEETGGGSCGVGNGTNGTYKGNIVLGGTDTAGNAVNISVN